MRKLLFLFSKLSQGGCSPHPEGWSTHLLLLCVSWVLLPLHSRYADNRIEAISLDLE
jgi:hypothetical protein